MPEKTAETLVDGRLHTGDAGFLSSDGYLHVVDRIKDMIITGGENVYSAEVETVIMELTCVEQCALIGRFLVCVDAVAIDPPNMPMRCAI
jgi:long-chain acyl-CoA synthetase